MAHHPPKKYIVYWIAKYPEKTYNDPYRARMKSFSDGPKATDFQHMLRMAKREGTLYQKREVYHVSDVYYNDTDLPDDIRTRPYAIETDWCVASFDLTEEKKDAIVARVLEFYRKHQSFHGESICQSDGPIMDGYCVLAEIADNILKFEVEMK